MARRIHPWPWYSRAAVAVGNWLTAIAAFPTGLGHALYHLSVRRKPVEKRLIYAAYARCPCGAGLAYDPEAEPDGPFKYGGHWDCSDIMLGIAVPSGQPGSVEHTAQLPFTFYEIKSEEQPSAAGATTRERIKSP